jgi:hypothetical protein
LKTIKTKGLTVSRDESSEIFDEVQAECKKEMRTAGEMMRCVNLWSQKVDPLCDDDDDDDE